MSATVPLLTPSSHHTQFSQAHVGAEQGPGGVTGCLHVLCGPSLLVLLHNMRGRSCNLQNGAAQQDLRTHFRVKKLNVVAGCSVVLLLHCLPE
ncbi:unnamed protein product [Pleuronectes platessa]|uniref:Uncharacterized protein n=1 Tax=Pleuronectes platessa TaxID=8262 RepID=A0A9N7Z9Q1_PLEPL|nr:unnamed protein product [Pleuronectes platessa]